MSDRVVSNSDYLPIVANVDDEAIFSGDDRQHSPNNAVNRSSSGYYHQPDVNYNFYAVPTSRCSTPNSSFAIPSEAPSPESIPQSDVSTNRFFSDLPLSSIPIPEHHHKTYNGSCAFATSSWRPSRVLEKPCLLFLLTIMFITPINCSPLLRSSKLICVHGSPRERHDAGQSPCLCDGGWTGELCELPEKLSCAHGDLSSDGTICICYPGYTGQRCDQLEHCPNGEVHNGKCKCNVGWKGKFCEQIICYNGGIAFGPYRCICQSNFLGRHCETCAHESCFSARNNQPPSSTLNSNAAPITVPTPPSRRQIDNKSLAKPKHLSASSHEKTATATTKISGQPGEYHGKEANIRATDSPSKQSTDAAAKSQSSLSDNRQMVAAILVMLLFCIVLFLAIFYHKKVRQCTTTLIGSMTSPTQQNFFSAMKVERVRQDSADSYHSAQEQLLPLYAACDKQPNVMKSQKCKYPVACRVPARVHLLNLERF